MRRWLALLALVLASACATAPPRATPAPPLAESPRIVWPEAPLQCVPFAREASGIEIYGDAHTWWEQAASRYARSSRPAPGAILVLRGWRDANRGHVAVVRHVVSDRRIVVDHANWHNRGEIALGAPVEDVSPRGDWSQVRVWHVFNAAWGGRAYDVQGFILPR